MFKQTIKVNILTVFLTLLGLISFVLLFSQHYFNHSLAVQATSRTFKTVVNNLAQQMENSQQKIENILISNKSNTKFLKEISSTYKHPALNDLIQILNLNPNILSIYFTQKNGSFYQLTNAEQFPYMQDSYKAPAVTKWIIITSLEDIYTYYFLNNQQKLLSSYSEKKEYHPLNSSWYQEAIVSKEVVRTTPYIFTSTKESGTTFAMELQEKGFVLAIDYTMKRLNEILKLQKIIQGSEIFLFDDNGNKFASSNYVISHNEMVDASLISALRSKEQNHIVESQEGEKEFLSIYENIGDKNLNLGVKVDSVMLFKPYNENMKLSFIIAILFLLFSIPVIFYATDFIVKPIKALISENQKIKNRQFDSVENIDTNIIEFIELSNSFVSMSQNIQEYQKAQAELLNSIVKLIAEAIDTKSPYTGGHCSRVPEIAKMLLKEASLSQETPFKEFSLESKEALREFEIGAWLHDCGKITTPEYVVDKATKLETIYNRIHEIRTRFEVLWRDAQIRYLQAQLNGEESEASHTRLNKEQAQLLDDFTFIANTNIGGEFMSEEKQERIKEIAKQEWQRNFDDSLGLGELEILRYDRENAQAVPVTEKLLADKTQHLVQRENFDYEAYAQEGFKEEVPKYLYNYGEIYNLCISKGTLSVEERYKIDEHVIQTIKMLEKIPFPAHMTKIPEYAGTHHETLIGDGYPRKLDASDLSIPARIMAIADVFEALTAADRPYKKAKTLSESIKLLNNMVQNGHLDGDLFKLFLKSDLHNLYAKKYLNPEQIDEVDIEQYL